MADSKSPARGARAGARGRGVEQEHAREAASAQVRSERALIRAAPAPSPHPGSHRLRAVEGRAHEVRVLELLRRQVDAEGLHQHLAAGVDFTGTRPTREIELLHLRRRTFERRRTATGVNRRNPQRHPWNPGHQHGSGSAGKVRRDSRGARGAAEARTDRGKISRPAAHRYHPTETRGLRADHAVTASGSVKATGCNAHPTAAAARHAAPAETAATASEAAARGKAAASEAAANGTAPAREMRAAAAGRRDRAPAAPPPEGAAAPARDAAARAAMLTVAASAMRRVRVRMAALPKDDAARAAQLQYRPHQWPQQCLLDTNRVHPSTPYRARRKRRGVSIGTALR